MKKIFIILLSVLTIVSCKKEELPRPDNTVITTTQENLRNHHCYTQRNKRSSFAAMLTHKTLKVYAERDGQKSATIATAFFKIDPNLTVTLKNKYANQFENCCLWIF